MLANRFEMIEVSVRRRPQMQMNIENGSAPLRRRRALSGKTRSGRQGERRLHELPPIHHVTSYLMVLTTSFPPTMRNMARMMMSSALVVQLFFGTGALHLTLLFRYNNVAARNGTNRLPTMV